MPLDADAILAAQAAAARGDFAPAVTLLRPIAAHGSAEAQFQLASLALTACELVSGREAFRLFQAAADQGHIDAMYYLATFPEFSTEAFSSPLAEDVSWAWLLRAADLGHVEAQYHAAACYATAEWGDRGLGQPDPVAALALYRRAAEGGHAEAQLQLGMMLYNGEGCEPDRPLGLSWVAKAAAQGHDWAQRLLQELGEGGG